MKKTGILMLVILMLSASLLSCGSCAGRKEPGKSTVSGVESESGTVEEKIDLDGITVSFVTAKFVDDDGFELFADKNATDAISEVIYRRNELIQRDLNVGLSFLQQDATEMVDNIRSYVLGGDSEWDVFNVYAVFSMENITVGVYQDLMRLENLDVSNDWWNQNYVSEVTFRDQLYTIVGDVNTSVVRKTMATFVNRDIAERFGKEEDLLDVVRSGNWTLEYLAEYTKDVYEEKNGDGQPSLGDTFGLLLGRISQPAEGLLESCNFDWTSRTDDTITINVNSPGNVNLLGKLRELFDSAENGHYAIPTNEIAGVYVYADLFAKGQALMLMGPMFTATSVAKSDAVKSYQILPLPKLEKSQAYRSSCQDSYTSLSVSANSDAKEQSAIVLERMGEASRQELTPAYCNTYYRVSVASDPETMEMFDTIKDSLVFSFARVYSLRLKTVAVKMRSLVYNGDEIASTLAGYHDMVQEYLEQLILDLENLASMQEE